MIPGIRGTLAKPQRFYIEHVDNLTPVGDDQISPPTSRGTTHYTGENFALLGLAGFTSANQSTAYQNYYFDGITRDFHVGVADNAQSEHASLGAGLFNITDSDYDRTMKLQLSTYTEAFIDPQYSYFRLIGGRGPVSVVYSNARARPSYSSPFTYTRTVQKSDLIVAFQAARGSYTFSCTNLNPYPTVYTRQKILAKVMDTSGTIDFTITSNAVAGAAAQFCDLFLHLRPTI